MDDTLHEVWMAEPLHACAQISDIIKVVKRAVGKA